MKSFLMMFLLAVSVSATAAVDSNAEEWRELSDSDGRDVYDLTVGAVKAQDGLPPIIPGISLNTASVFLNEDNTVCKVVLQHYKRHAQITGYFHLEADGKTVKSILVDAQNISFRQINLGTIVEPNLVYRAFHSPLYQTDCTRR